MIENGISLFDSYSFKEVSIEEFTPFFKENRPKVFANHTTIRVEDWMDDIEKQKVNVLSNLIKDRYQYFVLIYNGEETIGWHVGRQIEGDSYNMGNTGIFEQYQGLGIYTALLPKLLEVFKEKGFQKVTSRHHASNNAVLVPKLKAGFRISSFEIDERFGVLVHLSYIFNERRLNAYKYRTGELHPNEDIKKFL